MNNYQRGRLLGKGSFGSAFLVTERSSRKEFVMKEISLARMPLEEQKAAKQEAEVRCTVLTSSNKLFNKLFAQAC